MNLNGKVKGEYCFCFRSSVLLIFIIGLCLHDVLAKHVSILFALFTLFVFIFENKTFSILSCLLLLNHRWFEFQKIVAPIFDYLNEFMRNMKMWKVEFILTKPQLLTANLKLKVMGDLSHLIQNVVEMIRYDKTL